MRVRNLIATLVVVACAVCVVPMLAGQARAQDPAAVLLSCSGDVTIVRGGGEIKGTFGLNLEPGDEIRTGADSVAEIHFDDGNWVRMGANSSMQVKGQRSAPPSPNEKAAASGSMGAKSFQTVQNFIKLKDSEGSSSMARLRSADSQPELCAESPRQTVVRGLPTFKWKLTDPATALKLTVYNEEGVLWEHDVHGTTSVAYPGDAPALEPGTAYSWTLETTDPLKFPPLRSQAAFFEVLAAEDDKKLAAALDECSQSDGEETSESAKHIVRASLFFEYNLLDDAIAETQQAMAVDPENPALRSILARLYAQTGRSAEALDEYDKLLDQ